MWDCTGNLGFPARMYYPYYWCAICDDVTFRMPRGGDAALQTASTSTRNWPLVQDMLPGVLWVAMSGEALPDADLRVRSQRPAAEPLLASVKEACRVTRAAGVWGRPIILFVVFIRCHWLWFSCQPHCGCGRLTNRVKRALNPTCHKMCLFVGFQKMTSDQSLISRAL